jgi:plastocyanin
MRKCCRLRWANKFERLLAEIARRDLRHRRPQLPRENGPRRDERCANVKAHTQQVGNRTRARQGTLRIWLLGELAIIIGSAFLGCSRGPNDTANDNAPANASAFANASAPANANAPVVTQVSIRNLQFAPATIEVKTGDVVEWKNDDMVSHTATSASFNSGTIASGQSWRHTFTNAGNFTYVCTFHPQMKGVVIVK